jgi:hypothetical protein
MDDYDYDYGGGEEDIIDYNPDDYMMQQDDNGCGINFEDMFISAESATDRDFEYRQIIELEKDNSSDCKWSYKAYEKLCLLDIKSKLTDKFQNDFEKMFSLYNRIDDSDKQDTIRNFTFHLNDQEDKNFVLDILQFMLDSLKEKSLDRAVMDTGLQFAKTLFSLNRMDDLGELLESLLCYLDRLDPSDEIYKSIRLELLVMKIQFCNSINDSKQSKILYLEAEKLNQHQIIHDSRLTAIINEEGGKLHMRAREYELALGKFKSAFYSYQQTGNLRAKILYKYAILCAITARQGTNIVSPEEAKYYISDEKLQAMLALQSAYERLDIASINHIWNEKISKVEDDSFILENLNETLYNIRYNYICGKLLAYNRCNFTTLEREIGIERNSLISLLQDIILSESVDARLDFVRNFIQLVKQDTVKVNTSKNLNQWISVMQNQ